MEVFSLYSDALRVKRNQPNKLDVNSSGAIDMLRQGLSNHCNGMSASGIEWKQSKTLPLFT